MLEDFTPETFSPHVGSTFRACLDNAGTLNLCLATVDDLSARFSESPAGRRPFSIVFHGASEPVLPQRIYRLEHEVLGAFELFLVPIGPEPGNETMRYEAAFS